MQIVFNLYPFSDNLYLPVAYLVHKDQQGLLTYLAQRATVATCAPYGIEITPALKKAMDLCDLLVPKAIEAKFKPQKAKAPTPLAELLQPQNPAKKTVETYIHRHLAQFYAEVYRHQFALSLDAERKTMVKDVQIHHSKDELVPYLSFRRLDNGVEYRLRLGTETEHFPIHQHEVLALSNTDPAWLVVDYTLFKVPGINGFMVHPFRKKELVMIPEAQTKVYFKQFIAKAAGRTRIDAEGFDVQVAERLLGTHLRAVEDVLQQVWVLRPIFHYQNAQFDAGDKRDHLTTVEFDDATGGVLVKKIAREWAMENTRVDTLMGQGLDWDGRVALPEKGIHGQASLAWWVHWLAQYRKLLESGGFLVELPQVDDKQIALVSGTIALHTTAHNDWFDVHGEITVDNFRFAFKELVPYLRQQDPFFPLPDGTFFLIPAEWFARFGDLAKALRDTDGEPQLPKALFTLLESTGEETLTQTPDFPIIDPNSVEYTPGPELKANLRPYQVFGVKWLIGHYQHGFGACLADSMGLGKTLQTIALLLYAKAQRPVPLAQAPAPAALMQATPSKGFQLDLFHPVEPIETPTYTPTAAPEKQVGAPSPALIILPASLVFNWQKELEQFAPSLFVRAHTGPQRDRDPRLLTMYDVVLTTYQTARLDLELLSGVDWHFIILDESQYIKNRSSDISKVIRSLEAHHKISLSGTPIENSLSDLWTQMEFINPSILGSYPAFREQFQLPIEKYNDPVAKEQLFSRVRPFFLRRTKEEVAPDLPAKTEQVFYCEMSTAQRSQYEEIKSAVRNEILALFDDPKTRLLAIQALTRLRQLANHPALVDAQYEGDSGKMEDVLAQWDTLRRDGHKVLFFSSFTQHLELYRKLFDEQGVPYCWLTGETPQSARGGIVAQFQSDPNIQAFFCSIKAGGVGLNLTAADYVFLLDPWWNPAAEDQAIARAHRIGQTKPVNAVRFISRDSIEEKIRQMQERKQALGQALFDAAGEVPELGREDMAELLA